MICEAAPIRAKSQPSPRPSGAPPAATCLTELANSRRILMMARSAGTRCSFDQSYILPSDIWTAASWIRFPPLPHASQIWAHASSMTTDSQTPS